MEARTISTRIKDAAEGLERLKETLEVLRHPLTRDIKEMHGNDIDMAIDIMNNSYKWIPVEEQLPEKYVEVWVTYTHAQGVSATIDFWKGIDIGWHWQGNKVIAWTPLIRPLEPYNSIISVGGKVDE